MSYIIHEQLKKCPVFASCKNDILEQIEKKHSHIKKAKKGEVLISKDNFVPGLYIIIKGRARVQKTNTSDVFMSVIDEGGAFGMASMFSSGETEFPTEITALKQFSKSIPILPLITLNFLQKKYGFSI